MIQKKAKTKQHGQAPQHSRKPKPSNKDACNSAPSKQNPEVGDTAYLKMHRPDAVSTTRRSSAATENKQATSRFSSCTAKTSPSTEYNSQGVPAVHDWDPNLQSKICQVMESREESGTPSRVRASSDNISSGQQLAQSCQTNQKKQITSTSNSARSHQKAATNSRSEYEQQSMSAQSKAKGKTHREKQTKSGHPIRDFNPLTGARISTPYPGKYKTQLCKNYMRGEKCPYDLDCNYAHGKDQLQQRDCPRSENSSAQKPSSIKTKSHVDASNSRIARELFPRGQQSTGGQVTRMQMQPVNSLEEEKNCAASARKSAAETSQKMRLNKELTAGLFSAAQPEQSRKVQKNGEAAGDDQITDEDQSFEDEHSSSSSSDIIDRSPSSNGGKSEAPSQPFDLPTFVARSHSDMPKEVAINDGEQKEVAQLEGTASHTNPVLLYSSRLAKIELCLRRAQSESPTRLLAHLVEKTQSVGLEGVCEETESNMSACDLAESQMSLVRRLSCFEEIVPSELANSENEPTQLPAPQVVVDGLSTREMTQVELEHASSPEDAKISEDDDHMANQKPKSGDQKKSRVSGRRQKKFLGVFTKTAC